MNEELISDLRALHRFISQPSSKFLGCDPQGYDGRENEELVISTPERQKAILLKHTKQDMKCLITAAIMRDCLAVVQHFLDLSLVDAETTKSYLNTAQFTCKERIVSWLIANNTALDLAATDECGNTFLMCRQDPTIAQLLIDKGVDINAQNKQTGCTALIMAALRGDDKVFEVLLDNGADLNIESGSGETALIVLAERCTPDSHSTEQMLKLLLAQGPDLNIKNHWGRTALMILAERCAPDMLQTFLAYHPDINIRDEENHTALDYARKYSYPGAYEKALILKNYAQTAEYTTPGTLALMKAAKENDLNMVKWLVAQGVDINVPDESGVTPLMIAVKQTITQPVLESTDINTYRGHAALAIVKYLIDVGAARAPKDNNGKTVFHYWNENGNDKFFDREVLDILITGMNASKAGMAGVMLIPCADGSLTFRGFAYSAATVSDDYVGRIKEDSDRALEEFDEAYIALDPAVSTATTGAASGSAVEDSIDSNITDLVAAGGAVVDEIVQSSALLGNSDTLPHDNEC